MKTIALTTEDIAQAAEYLRAHSIWKAIPETELERLLRQAQVSLYEKGELIWGGGAEYRRAIGLVLEGEAQVKKEHLLLSVHRRGDFFGLVTLFNPCEYYTADIAALQPCRIVFIEKSAIEALLDAHPAAAKEYIAYLSQRVYFLNGRLDAVTAGSAAERLESHLRAVAEPEGEQLVCEIENFSALAKTLSMGRASLYRALEVLAAQGVIEREGGRIIVRK